MAATVGTIIVPIYTRITGEEVQLGELTVPITVKSELHQPTED